MNNAEVLIKFKGDSSNVEQKISGLQTKMTDLVKGFTIGSVAAKGITKAFETFSANLDGAINRVDIMNNFPKVMSNLGISAKDSDEVIKDLSKNLQGLPTTIDSAATSVQRFTSKNGNVKESEKLFLAVNNAILAGGASSEIQANALEQISQAYAKGKPDMMEWRTLMTAMPAQLKQVATAMGYVDAAMLGEAVRADGGEKEFTRMMDTIMRMNTEGVNGFKSFSEQARNSTGGIQTSITNMKTAFVRGVADIINKINESLEPFGGLSGVINTIGQIGETAFKKIGDIISWVIPKFFEISQWINKNKAWIEPLTIAILSFITAFKGVKTVIAIVKGFQTAFALLNATMIANPIGLIIAAIAALVAAFIYLWNHCEGFRNFFIGLWQGIIAGIQTVWAFLQTIFQIIVGAVTTFIQTIWTFISPIFDFIKNALYLVIAVVAIALETIYNILIGVSSWIWNNVLSPVVNFFTSAFNTIRNAVVNVFNAIRDTISNIFNAIGNIIKTPINGIISGINEVLKTLNKIKIPDWVPGVGGKGINFKMIPKLATGTNYVPDDTLAIIHKGEAVIPKKFNPYAGVNSMSSQFTNSIGSVYNPQVNVVVNNNMEIDPLGQVVNKIKTFSGGAKNDYNWGASV